jgi:hypothetical protein
MPPLAYLFGRNQYAPIQAEQAYPRLDFNNGQGSHGAFDAFVPGNIALNWITIWRMIGAWQTRYSSNAANICWPA